MEGVDKNEVIGYMMTPLGLTERQLLIYQKLYEKCNFQNMTVKYTTSQIKSDIKIIDIDINVVYREMKFLINKGFIEVAKQGRKGNPSIYKIVRIDDLIRKLNESYVKTERKLKPSNSKALSDVDENYVKTKRKLSENPIKEKEKENNIYSANDYENIWNLYPNKKGKAIAIKKIPMLLKKYSKEELLSCVTRYSKEVQGKERQYILNGSTFFNSRYEDYLDSNYQELKTVKDISASSDLLDRYT